MNRSCVCFLDNLSYDIGGRCEVIATSKLMHAALPQWLTFFSSGENI